MDIPSIVVAAIGLLSAAIGYFIGIKQLYVDIVVKSRMQSINDNRKTLQDLYYYTNPTTIEFAIQHGKVSDLVFNLLMAQSSLEHRLLEVFYPDGNILSSIRTLVEQAVNYASSGTRGSQYDMVHDESLRLLKLYNFSSWQYAQHSTGRRGNSVKGFDKAFLKTLKSLEQNAKVKAAIEQGLIKYKVSR